MRKIKKVIVGCLVSATILGGGTSVALAAEDSTAGQFDYQPMYIPTEASISPKHVTYKGVSKKTHTVKLSWGAGVGNSYRVTYDNGEYRAIDRTTSATSINYDYTYQKVNTSQKTWNTKLSVSNGNTANVYGSVTLKDR